MFQFEPPEAFEILRGSRLLSLSERESRLLHNNKEIVIVSIFGTSQLNDSSGYKKAFRLAIDSFGHLCLFSEESVKIETEEIEIGIGDTEEKSCSTLSLSEKDSIQLIGEEIETNTESLEEKVRSLNLNDKHGFSFPGINDENRSRRNSRAGTPTQGGREGSSPFEDILSKDIPIDVTSKYNEELGWLDGFYCENEGIIFLHLEGAYDPKLLMEAGEELTTAIEDTGFIPVWSTLKSKYCKYLLLMFSLSHVIILSDIGGSFDTNYLHLFRVLDAVRLEIKTTIVRTLEKLENLPKDWITHGRICSPRLLFLFEVETESLLGRLKNPSTLLKAPIKEKQVQLEDEIYHILRKCRIITNISANSLFAIPSQDEYVFLFNKSAHNATSHDEPLSTIYSEVINEACSSTKNSASKPKLAHRSASGLSVKHLFRPDPDALTYNDLVAKFKDFVCVHTQLAQIKGFEDDSRRVSEHKHFFVRPTFKQWKSAFSALSDCLFKIDDSDQTISKGMHELKRYLDVDSVYLENQCASAFPKIYQIYQRGLPEFYPEQIHQLRLNYAMNAFLCISHGPGVVPWLKKLAEKCDKYWKNGRQQCEVKSLFLHSCTNPTHRIAPEDCLETLVLPETDMQLPEMEHCTGSRLISYCNCGRRQITRDEPFTIREANYSFYVRAARDCCDRLEQIECPVFIPTQEIKKLSLQEMIQILQKNSINKANKKVLSQTVIEANSNSPSQEMETELRQENILVDGDDADYGSETSQNEEFTHSEALLEGDVPETLESTQGNIDSILDNETENSPDNHSKSEYLPGMLHSKSPLGLLPLFPSWSIVCLGSSSLYNHSSGVNPRTGFLNGTNFLLPWDVMVKAEAGVSKPVPRFIRGKRPFMGRVKPITDEFNVKVFIGFEYECHRGHRFIANDFEHVVNNQGSSMASLREAGTKIASSDMPLYFKCPCKESRDGKTMIAQLMRIHVVTPKAPVHCILLPRVQPTFPPCSIFFPKSEDIKLAPSSYWVLRLPYCYVGDKIYFQDLKDNDVTRSNGKFLKGTFNVKSMSPAETAIWERQNLS